MLYPSLIQSFILSLFLTELLNCCLSFLNLSVLCCYTLPLCACVPVLSASIVSSVIFFFFANPDRNVQHLRISFPQLLLKQNTTEESLHILVLQNVPLVSSFAAYCSGVAGKFFFFFCCWKIIFSDSIDGTNTTGGKHCFMNIIFYWGGTSLTCSRSVPGDWMFHWLPYMRILAALILSRMSVINKVLGSR